MNLQDIITEAEYGKYFGGRTNASKPKMTKAHAKILSRLLIKMSVESVIPHKDVLFVNYTNYKERTKIIKAASKLYSYDDDGRMTNAPRGIQGVGGNNWIAFKSRHNESVNEGQPAFQDKPNEFAYLEFKKWAYSNRNAVKGILLKAMKEGSDPGTALFLALRQVWLAWSNKKAKQWSRIPNKGPQGKDFGRALAVMMKKDNLIISRSTNKLTDVK